MTFLKLKYSDKSYTGRLYIKHQVHSTKGPLSQGTNSLPSYVSMKYFIITSNIPQMYNMYDDLG